MVTVITRMTGALARVAGMTRIPDIANMVTLVTRTTRVGGIRWMTL